MSFEPEQSSPEHGQRRLGRTMIALAWLAALGIMSLWFADYLDRQANPNRNVAVQRDGTAELVLKRNRAGHYLTPGTINGQPVNFLLDTGATQVSVPAAKGEQLGLRAGRPITVVTANGTATAYATVIDEIAFGPFVLRDVQGGLNPGMAADEDALLGMNVLRHLEFTQRGDTLILRVHQD